MPRQHLVDVQVAPLAAHKDLALHLDLQEQGEDLRVLGVGGVLGITGALEGGTRGTRVPRVRGMPEVLGVLEVAPAR